MLFRKYDSVSGHGVVVNNLCMGLERLGFEMTLGSFSFVSEPPPEIKKLQLKVSMMLNGNYDKNFDIIHNHNGLTNYFSLFTRKPFIFHYHGTPSRGQDLNRRIYIPLCSKKISKIICVSNASYEWVKNKIGKIPAEVIHNGVNIDFYKTNLSSPYKKGIPQLLFVGNLHKTKQTIKLVNMMKSILGKYPNAHLQIVGVGKDYNALQDQIKRKNLENRIEMLGKVIGNELRLRYSSCDIYISASQSEACPLPPLEAMACGKPLLLSNIPQHNEVVKNSDAGKSFTVNDENDIKTKITNVFENKESYGKNARKYTEKLSWDLACKKVAKIYDEFIS